MNNFNKPNLEEKLIPICGFKLNLKIPHHCSETGELEKYKCNDSRSDDCPFGIVIDNKSMCNYK